MDVYTLILINSFKSAIAFSTVSENAWFAAVQFGSHNLWFATFAAVIGSACGALLNFTLGYYVGGKRGDWFAFSEQWYQRITRYNNYTMFVLMVPFSAIPVIGTFFNLYILIAGFLRIAPRRAIALIVTGRILYYLLCLAGVNV
ncbi:MAG TPA: VTT domain-containing protein [Rickettsiales bacterium]|nr:VTT domain-containing protein [Rickettsiales bacterium]